MARRRLWEASRASTHGMRENMVDFAPTLETEGIGAHFNCLGGNSFFFCHHFNLTAPTIENRAFTLTPLATSIAGHCDNLRLTFHQVAKPNFSGLAVLGHAVPSAHPLSFAENARFCASPVLDRARNIIFDRSHTSENLTFAARL